MEAKRYFFGYLTTPDKILRYGIDMSALYGAKPIVGNADLFHLLINGCLTKTNTTGSSDRKAFFTTCSTATSHLLHSYSLISLQTGSSVNNQTNNEVCLKGTINDKYNARIVIFDQYSDINKQTQGIHNRSQKPLNYWFFPVNCHKSNIKTGL